MKTGGKRRENIEGRDKKQGSSRAVSESEKPSRRH